jgi:hypothetical protein
MVTEQDLSCKKKQVLLVGSSHTSLSYLYMKKRLCGKAEVSKLPYYAGNTEEMLVSLPDWPLEGKDIVHVYAGLRDLAQNDMGQPMVGPEKFRKNLETIYNSVASRCSAKIIFSNVPPVEDNLLLGDLLINERIQLYNHIIEEVVAWAGIELHNFSEFVLSHESGTEKYSDGLHFTRNFYKEYAENLADFLMNI